MSEGRQGIWTILKYNIKMKNKEDWDIWVGLLLVKS
jgi:hypothetical protein